MEKTELEGFCLSPQQRRIWKLQMGSGTYRAQCAVAIKGDLDPSVLKHAALRVISRHDSLRLTFQRCAEMKVPLQTVADTANLIWQEIRHAESASAGQSAPIDDLFEQERSRPFSYEHGPLLHATLISVSANEHVLLIALPALCSDSKSLENLTREIAFAYAAIVNGNELTEEPMQFARVAEWQNDLLEGEDDEETREFWRRQDCLPADFLKLPFETKAPSAREFAPKSINRTVDAALVAKLEKVASTYDASPDIVLHAVWHAVLSKLTGETRIITGNVYDGREYEILQDALGLYAKYLPAESRVDESFHLTEIIRQLKESTQETFDRHESFIWRERATGDDGGYPAAAFEFTSKPANPVAAGVTFSIARQSVCWDRFKIKLSCVHSDADWQIDFYYDDQLMSATEIERLADQYLVALRCTADNPETSIADLNVTSETAAHSLLAEFNQTDAPYPSEKCVHQLIEEQVERTPDAPAVAFESQQLSYRDLNARANQLAHRLQWLGVKAETNVALCVERSVDLIVGLLGIMKAGGTYVPLDPSQPIERLAFMVEETRPHAMVTQSSVAGRFPAFAGSVVNLDTDWEVISRENTQNPASDATSSNLVYVILTSGSTGRPKGVAVEHKQLVNYVTSITERLAVPPGASFAMVSTISADLGNTSIFPSLLTGGCLHILSHERTADPNALADYFSRNPIDVLKIVPSHLEGLLGASFPENVLPRRCLVLGGESSRWQLIERIQNLAPNCRILNHYGPSETTVGVLTHRVSGRDEAEAYQTVPLSLPVANARIYLLDSQMQPSPFWIAGEIYIGGDCVARGYVDRPELTADRFVPDPFSRQPGARLYRTGDKARRLSGGQIEFLGRLDHQVKIRGYRVELGEVEAVLREHPGVKETVVAAREDQSGELRLAAYIVPEARYAAKIEGKPRYQLANGLAVVNQNRGETDYLCHEIFEAQTYFRYGIQLPEEACVFDIGANIGFFSIFVALHRPKARIYTFEPMASTFEVLKLNASLYAPNAKPFQIGISDREKLEAFTFYPRHTMMSGVAEYANPDEEVEVVKRFMKNAQHSGDENMGVLLQNVDNLLDGRFEGEQQQVRLRSLSDVMREEGVTHIDLLKIDVQRAELDVLNGIDEDDWEKIDQISMELHDGEGWETEGRVGQIKAILESHGFKAVAEQDELLEGTDRWSLYAIRNVDNDPDIAERQRQADCRLPEIEIQPRILTSVDLRDFMKDRLPDYMVPPAFILMEELPLTRNGKIDRRALPDPDKAQAESAKPFVAPRTPVEAAACNIFADVLNLEQVGIDDNFFDLGGHSLLVMLAISRMQEVFQIDLPVRTLFEEPTPEGMARQITLAQDQQELTGSSAHAIPRRSRDIDAQLDELGRLTQDEAQALLNVKL